MKTKPTPTPLVHSIDDTCQKLGICRATFYKQAKKGKIKIVKFGSRSKVGDPEVQRIAQEGF